MADKFPPPRADNFRLLDPEAPRTQRIITEISKMRRDLIGVLQNAMQLAQDLDQPRTAHLIERALDEARSQQFRPKR
jgi:hypothetical protein